MSRRAGCGGRLVWLGWWVWLLPEVSALSPVLLPVSMAVSLPVSLVVSLAVPLPTLPPLESAASQDFCWTVSVQSFQRVLSPTLSRTLR